MQEARVNYLWVGGFVLVAGVLFFTALAVLAGRTGATDSYHTVFERVTGISGAPRSSCSSPSCPLSWERNHDDQHQ